MLLITVLTDLSLSLYQEIGVLLESQIILIT